MKKIFLFILFLLFFTLTPAFAIYSNYTVIEGNPSHNLCREIRDSIQQKWQSNFFYYNSQPWRTTLRIKLLSNGKLDSYKIVKPSGNTEFDNALINSIKSVHYPALSKSLSNNYVVLELTYGYDGLMIVRRPNISDIEFYQDVFNKCIILNTEKLIANRIDTYTFTVEYTIANNGSLISKKIIKSTNDIEVDKKY